MSLTHLQDSPLPEEEQIIECPETLLWNGQRGTAWANNDWTPISGMGVKFADGGVYLSAVTPQGESYYHSGFFLSVEHFTAICDKYRPTT